MIIRPLEWSRGARRRGRHGHAREELGILRDAHRRLSADYLERLGVEVIFGLCGHTVIALLDAIGKSRIRFVSTRHQQVAAHAADGYARASGKHPKPLDG